MQLDNVIHVSFHIEKSAGTTVLSVLESMYGKESVLEYNTRINKLVYSKNPLISRTNPLMNRIYLALSGRPVIKPAYKLYTALLTNKYTNPSKLYDFSQFPNNTRALHGHFYPSDIKPIILPTFKTIVFREPLQRMLSQYKHWKRIRGYASWRFPVVYDKSMTFEKYAMLPTLRNYQSKAIEHVNLDYFDLIGISENLSNFISKLSSMQAFDSNSVPKNINYNSSPNTDDMLNNRFKKQFKKYHSKDYELYVQAKKLANK